MAAFFDIASPLTLASLIADIDEYGQYVSTAQREMQATAHRVLENNVGKPEAEQMVQRQRDLRMGKY
jgi:hypothetical protein